jgi:diguanylate cyclase
MEPTVPTASAQKSSVDITDSEKAAEYLRLTLPLLSRHKIPATPANYAVWYTYVTGENPSLRAEIDRLIAAEEAFTPSICAHLHRRFIAEQDLDEVDQVRSDLAILVQEVGGILRTTGRDVRHFGDSLENFADQVSASASDDLQSLGELVNGLIHETREVRNTTGNVEVQFKSKSREIEHLQAQLIAERKRAMSDPLTGLYNRAVLFERMEAAISDSKRGHPPSVIMFDIDHFKRINDAHGHLIGDRVIRFVAQTLKKCIKGGDLAARFGGEEFTVLLPRTASAGAIAVAQSVRKTIADAQLVRADNKQPISDMTISAGVATYRDGEDAIGFLNRADQALYQAKKDGRNLVRAAT